MAGLTEDPRNWRLSTDGGIKYRLISMSGQFDADDASITEEYIIQASDLAAFTLESFPDTVSSGSSFTIQPKRRLPGSNSPNVFTQTVGFEGFTSGKPIDPYGSDPNAPSSPAETYEQFVKLTINYTNDASQDDDDDGEFLNITATASGEFLLLPMRDVDFGDEATQNPLDPPENVVENKDPVVPATKLLPMEEYRVSLPSILITALPGLVARARARMGAVNSQPMPVFWDAVPETILFTGYGYEKKYSWKGVSASFDMTFLEKAVVDQAPLLVNGQVFIPGRWFGHNHFWNPELRKFQKILVEKGPPATFTYKLTDLNPLLVFT